MNTNTHRIRGLTLIELLLTMTLVAGLIVAANAGYRSWAKQQMLSHATGSLLKTLRFARSHAIVANTRVAVCPRSSEGRCTRDAYAPGWIVFVENPATSNGRIDAGETVLQSLALDHGSLSIRSSNSFSRYIAFSGLGRANQNGRFVLCFSGRVAGSELIIISRTGRIRLAPDADADGIPETGDGRNISDCLL